MSADWSSLINSAYKTLLAPIKRGEYLLKLHGAEIPEDNNTVDRDFLLKMMERNEEVILYAIIVTWRLDHKTILICRLMMQMKPVS